MKAPSDTTVIVGAGVIGVMTAYALAKRGHTVTLIDRLSGPAELCSHGNAGIAAVGHSSAWAEPSAIPAIARALVGREPKVRITTLWDPELWRWGVHFLRHCTPAAHRRNSDKLQRLSQFSCALIKPIEAAMQLPADTREGGALYLFQDTAQFKAHIAAFADHGPGGDQEVLDRDQVLAYEPGLMRMADTIAGGLLSRPDISGDCKRFTTRTQEYLSATGKVDFRFETDVTGFRRDGRRIVAVQTDRGDVPCKQVVFATGVETPDITAPLGFKPLIYPVKGYSSTWRILDPKRVPQMPYIDETELLSVANYGDRMRVTATAEFAARDKSLPQDRLQVLRDYVQRAFGDAVHPEALEYWTGLRPSTPDGPPYLGRVRVLDNAWINAGHGQLGWTMSFGSGEVLAQALSGETPALSNISAQASWLDSI